MIGMCVFLFLVMSAFLWAIVWVQKDWDDWAKEDRRIFVAIKRAEHDALVDRLNRKSAENEIFLNQIVEQIQQEQRYKRARPEAHYSSVNGFFGVEK